MTEQEQTLLELYRDLSKDDAYSLLMFARFLSAGEQYTAISELDSAATEKDQEQQPSDVEKKIPQPEQIARPEEERVVDALKRLSATYPMLEKKRLLDKASELVAQHVMFGKPAIVVINEIEEMFAAAYKQFVEEFEA